MIQINIYRKSGVWYGAIWIDGEWDSCDELPCDDYATVETARKCAESMHLRAAGPREVNLVDSSDAPSRSQGCGCL